MTGIEVSRILRRVWRDSYITCVNVEEREEGREQRHEWVGNFGGFV
jgi:hypothetical protein